MTQPTLFPDDRYQPPTLARATDPATSQAAAAAVEPKLPAKTQAMLDEIRRRSHPCTANEAAYRCADQHGGMAETYRKRAGELERDGRIIKVGCRLCTITMMRAAEYAAAK